MRKAGLTKALCCWQYETEVIQTADQRQTSLKDQGRAFRRLGQH